MVRFAPLATLLVLPFCTGLVHAQTARLNGPFLPDHIGEVRAFVIAPNARVVYLADQDVQGSIEIYNAPAAGGAAPIRLAAPGLSPIAATTLAVSPDGQRVVYSTDDEHLPERFKDLFSVPMDGSGSAVRLNGTLVTGGSVLEYSAGPARVVYRADALTNETFELFSAPLDGSSPAVRISGTLVAAGTLRPGRSAPTARASSSRRTPRWTAPMSSSRCRPMAAPRRSGSTRP